jgi:hypothetical protein
MSFDWHKADNPRVLAFRDLRIAEGRKATEHEAWSETLALLAVGRLDRFAFATYARSLGWDRGRLKRRLADWAADVDAQLVNMTPPWWRTAQSPISTGSSEGAAQQTHSKRTADAPRARSFLEKKKESKTENAADAAGTNEPKSGIKAAQTRAATQTTIKLRTLIRSIKGEQDNKRKPSKELISLVKGRLDQGYTEEDLGWLVRWACLGTDEAARWFQQHEGGRFCNLDTLLRRGSQKGGAVDKFEKNRIPAMEAWRKAGCRIGGRWAANADEVVAQRKPQQAKGGIPSDDMVAVVLDIARQLREGARPLAVSWPRWLDVLDDRRVRLTAHVMRSPDDVATIDDPSKAKGLLEAA